MNSLENALSDQVIDIECPECSQEFEIEISKSGSVVTCPHCESDFNFEVTGLDEIENKVDDMMDDFADSLEKQFNKIFK